MSIGEEILVFRRAGMTDVESLVDLRVRFLNELYQHPDDEKADQLRTVLREYFATAIADETFIAWLATLHGKVVGTSGLVLWRIPARYSKNLSGRMGYVLNFYTVPEARRMGICTRLLQELMNEARTRGVTMLQLHATRDGMDIYRSSGFDEPELPVLELEL